MLDKLRAALLAALLTLATLKPNERQELFWLVGAPCAVALVWWLFNLPH